jgi:peptide/nickel transport system permease protein
LTNALSWIRSSRNRLGVIPYLIKRLLESGITIFIGITLTFIIVHLAPGDPSVRFLDQTQTLESRQMVQKRFGLDEPLHIQYFKWIEQVVFHFNFGTSFYYNRATGNILASAIYPTILLALFALILALVLGILLGILAALRKNSLLDNFLTSVMMVFYSTPTFWIGIILLGLFASKLGWFPTSQMVSLYHFKLSCLGRMVDIARHLFLPVVTLGLPLTATIFRYIRAGMIEALNADYILAARARGISHKRIRFQYGLQNSLLPIINLLGIIIPGLLGGAVMVEVIFSLPGIGRLIVSAVFGRDYPLIMAANALAFILVVAGNFLADIFTFLTDPRIHYK